MPYNPRTKFIPLPKTSMVAHIPRWTRRRQVGPRVPGYPAYPTYFISSRAVSGPVSNKK